MKLRNQSNSSSPKTSSGTSSSNKKATTPSRARPAQGSSGRGTKPLSAQDILSARNGGRSLPQYQTSVEHESGRLWFKELSIVALISSLFVSFFVNAGLNRWNHRLSYAILMAFSFAFFAFVLGLACLMTQLVKGALRACDPGRGFLAVLAGTIVFFLLALLLQFLYGLGEKTRTLEFKQYYFIVDDSGSMAQTDPSNERYQALRTLLNDLPNDQEVGLIRFNETIIQTLPMKALDEKQRSLIDDAIRQVSSNGGTDIEGAVLKAIEELAQRPAKNLVNMLLLSDGISRVNQRRIVEACMQNDVILNSISLGHDSSGERVLTQLSEGTGGLHYQIEKLPDLAATLKQSKIVSYRRHLLGQRAGVGRNSLGLAFLRILFITLLGLLTAFYLIAVLGQEQNRQNVRSQILLSGLGAFLAALVLEFGFRKFYSGDWLRLLAFALMSLVFLTYTVYLRTEIPTERFTRDYGSRTSNDAQIQNKTAGDSILKR